MQPEQYVAVITGAGRGIGAAIARVLAAGGARVALLARSGDQVAAVAEEITAAGGTAIGLSCDVSDGESIDRALTRIRAELGRVSVLINNAGVIHPIGRLGETDPEDWLAGLAINLGGTYRVTRAALADLVAAPAGVIVNVSSGASSRALEGWSSYCVSKAGVAMLTQALHLEYGGDGLAVYGVRPGLVDTAMQGEIRESGVGPIAKVPRTQLIAPDIPARLIRWLIRERPAAWRGTDIDVRDEPVRKAAGLDR